MRTRTLAIVLTLAALWPNTAPAEVALVGPRGPRSGVVKKELTRILTEIDGVVDERALLGKERGPTQARARRRWLIAWAEEKEVSHVVDAELSRGRLRLTVIAPGSPDATWSIGLSGKMSTSVKQAIDEFLREAILGEAPVATQPAVAVAPSERPKTRSRVSLPDPTQEEEPADREPVAPPAAPRAKVEAPKREHLAIKDEVEPLPEEQLEAGLGAGLLARMIRTPAGSPPLVIASAEMTSVSRWFSYHDPITSNLRPFQVAMMPAPGASLELYPLVFTRSALAASLGIEASFHQSIGVQSSREGGPSYPTKYSHILVGGKYRLPLGSSETPPLLVAAIGWERSALSIEAASDGAEELDLPDVAYSGLRLGAGFELPIADVIAFSFAGAFVKVLSAGEILSEDYHRAGSANGFEAELRVRVPFTRGVAAEAGVQYHHFFYAFEPEVGDRYVAGGALDRFLTARAGLRLEL